MKKSFLSFFVFLLSVQGFSSVYLYNDTPFVLTAKVIAANGVNVGEKALQPQQLSYLEDQLGSSDPVNTQQQHFQNYKDSLTPYTVFWYCKEGALYSTCEDQASGATVMASVCSGSKYCKPPKPESQESEDSYKQE